MKNTDIVAKVLREAGVTDFFAVTGGAAVHIIDSLIQHGDMKAVFHHHEQAAALAADSYARLRNLGVCVVTTGPGVTNALTGLLCSWQDSVPTVFISGQARHSLTGLGADVRQVGTQHLEVIPIVQHMTKKAVMLKPGDNIEDVLVELIQIAQSGRKGPVWLDIPLDLQIQDSEKAQESKSSDKKVAITRFAQGEVLGLQNDLSQAARPILLLGRGIHGLSQEVFEKTLQILNVPCVRTWGFLDSSLVIPEEYNCGVVGVSGQRGANKMISESDLVLSLGARWGQAVVGPLIEKFAPNAKVHIVDIDQNELTRTQAFLPHANSHKGDAAELFQLVATGFEGKKSLESWHKYCKGLCNYNYEQNYSPDGDGIDQYALFKLLDQNLHANTTIVIDGGGTIVYCSMQILRKLPDRTIVIPSASAPMGTGIPHAIGAQISFHTRHTILVCGDGSFPFNIQELQTVQTNKLPIKIIVVNNNGYLSIQGTQDQFLKGRHFGSAPDGGLEIPNFEKIVKAFGIQYDQASKYSNLSEKLESLTNADGPAVLEVHIKQGQWIYPRTGFRMGADGKFTPLPLSEMHPEKIVPDFC